MLLDNQESMYDYMTEKLSNIDFELLNKLPINCLAAIIIESFLLGIKYEKAKQNELFNNER